MINKQVASAAGGHCLLATAPFANSMSGYISAEAYFCLKTCTEIARVRPSSKDFLKYSLEHHWHCLSSP